MRNDASDRGRFWSRVLAVHSLLAAAWIVLSNLLMRIPAALRGEPLDRLLAEALHGSALSRSETSDDAPDGHGRAAPGHLAIRCGVRIHMVERCDVRWIEADGDHVQIHTTEKSYRTRGTLTAYERELAADGFLRVHRSALVHPRAIREIQPFYRGDHVAVLRDGSEIRIPRTREDVLEALLEPTVAA